MTVFDIAQQRLHNERLIGPPFPKPEDVVQWLGAVQAQDYAGAKWAIGQRVKNCLDAAVEQAYVDGRILRTHVMRPTWHFVMPADIRWMLQLTAPRVKKAMAYYDRKLELDDTVFRRANAAITRALQGGKHRTRTELGRVLEEAGITAGGQRLGYIIMGAELDALICSGVLRGKQHTYALLDDRAPRARTRARDEALAELTKRYFSSHGPALVQDFAWWAGLNVADARSGIEMAKPLLLSETLDRKTYWFASSSASPKLPDPTVHLLPNYDEYLIAYRDHSPSLDRSLPADSAVLNDVLARHFIALNGRVIGGWRNVPARNEVVIETKLLVPLNLVQTEALQAEADRYSRFLAKPVKVRATQP